MTKKQKHTFEAILENHGSGADTAFVKIPLDVNKVFGTKGQVKVVATFDGHTYRGVLANMGQGSHIIGVRKDIRQAIGKKTGDSITVTIEQDLLERIVNVPPELNVIFSKHKKVKLIFDALSFTNRKEYAQWISEAKKEETKKKRLQLIPGKLLNGKRNPSEK